MIPVAVVTARKIKQRAAERRKQQNDMTEAPVTRKSLLKVIVVGDSGVGKTAIVRRLVDDRFMEEHKATIGADLCTKNISIENEMITLQIWDTAGQERFQSLGSAFYRGADACVFVYDICDVESFNHIRQWQKSFIEHASDIDSGEFQFLLLANKCDLSSRQVSQEQGSDYATQEKMLFYECSAKTGNSIEEAFKSLAESAAQQEVVAYYPDEIAEKIQIEEEQYKALEQGGCTCDLL